MPFDGFSGALRQGTAIEDVLAALAKSTPIVDPRMQHLAFAKAGTFAQPGSATSGLQFYDLEAGAKHLYPVLTPLRNETPRVPGAGGIQANWRAITGVNTSSLRVGVSSGHRGGNMAITTQDYLAAYKGIGIESSVDFEAQYAAMNFEDIRALGALTGLQALMLGEEILLLGGNTSVALGTTPTPSCTGAITGGTLSGAGSPTVYSVIVVALTLEGYLNSSVSGGVPAQLTRTNADGSTDTFGGGSARKSANGTFNVASGSTGSGACTVAAVQGAVGYAWYWGASGAEVLGAITTVPAYTVTATATGTQTAASMPAADNSQNSLSFDGLLTQALKSGSGAYYKDLGGVALTADNAGGIVEIDAALKDRWDNYRLGFDTIWINSQEAINLGKKIMAQGGNTGALRFVINQDQGAIGGGIMVATYKNKFSLAGANVLDVRIHPNMPPGMILMTTKKLPYPLSNVTNVWQVRTRQDYYQIEWPLVTRQYQYGVYADQVLQHYFPPSMGIISGILNG